MTEKAAEVTPPEDALTAIAYALHRHGYEPDDYVREEADPEHFEQAEAVIPAVVELLRERGRLWMSSDLMDAAAWFEGSL